MTKKLPVVWLLLLFVTTAATAFAADDGAVKTKLVNDVSYYSDEELAKGDEYQKSQCRLDILYPEGKKGFATVVWFHGGGLTGGRRYLAAAFKQTQAFQKGNLAIIGVGYRLSPKVKYPVFIQDAAAAVAWTIKNIDKYGGDPNKVFVSGGSAGGYLTAMVGMDSQWLKARGVDPLALAGLMPVSGQMTTHFHVKKLLNIPGEQYQPVIDKNAPLFYCSKNLPPIYLIMGDRKIEWKARVEENELLYASLRALGHPLVVFSESPGIGHAIAAMGDKTPKEVIPKIDTFIDDALRMKSKTDFK